MKNPFTEIAEADRPRTVDAWVTAGVVEDSPSGWDLLRHHDEWGMYTLGQVRRLAELAGVPLTVTTIDLGWLLHSAVVTETMEKAWFAGIRSLDDVYMDLILKFQKTTQTGRRGLAH